MIRPRFLPRTSGAAAAVVRIRTGLLCVALGGLATGCDGADPATPDENEPSDAVPQRYAAHRFAAVGDTVDLRGYGRILDAATFSPSASVAFDLETYSAACVGGGAGWVRFRYRDAAAENGVQTLVVVCITDRGDCGEAPGVLVDLETFRSDADPRAADLLAAGDGALQRVCYSTEGVRLQPPPALPPLMYRVVDAWGDGPYSVAGQELEWLRASRVVGYSGVVQDPAWIATVSRAIDRVQISADGGVDAEWEACASSPECPVDGNWIREGDLVVVTLGAPDLVAVVRSLSEDALRAFTEVHAPGAWAALEGAAPTGSGRSVREELALRITGALLLDRAVRDFDDRYGVSAAGARIGFGGFWQARTPLQCLPEDRDRCDAAEAILGAFEAAIIEGWRPGGAEVWWVDFVGYAPDGSPRTLPPPALEAFDGALGLLDLTGPADEGVDRPEALADAVRNLSSVAPVDLPLAFAIHWGPMAHTLEPDGFCEGEICPSAFTRYVGAFQPAIVAMLEAFPPGRVVGFGLPMFDGAHFDITGPYETLGGLELNRVAETGFNNPLLGLYYGQ